MKRLDTLQLDALAESGNISMGAAATALSQLLGCTVQITTPRLSYTTVGEVRRMYPVPCVLVRVRYTQGLQGNNLFILSDRDAGVIANMMMGDPDMPLPDRLDELYLSAVSEAMNQMMGSSSTAMSEMFGRVIDITPPELAYLDLGAPSDLPGLCDGDEVVQVAFDLTVGEYIASKMIQLVPVDFAGAMVAELLGSLDGAAGEEEIAFERQDAGLKDIMAEIGNISMGAAATALSVLMDRRVDITTPLVSLVSLRQLEERFPVPCVLVHVRYANGFDGENVLVIREEDAALIAAAMMGLEIPGTLDEISLSAVSEAMNQMMGSSATALSDMFGCPVEISPPDTEYKKCGLAGVAKEHIFADDVMVQVSFRMEVAGLFDSELVQLIPLVFARKMASDLLEGMGAEDPLPGLPPLADTPVVLPKPDLPKPDKVLCRPEYMADEIQDGVPLELLRDIPVSVTGLFGRSTVALQELMAVTAGSVVELDCVPDAPVDILANGKLVARGEVVVVGDRFGIKITEILQPWQRS